MAPRSRPGEGGGAGDGDLGAAPELASATAERIAATEQLIARLEADLAEARGAGEAAGETRARVALAAAEGDPAARAELEAATAAATRAVLGAENVGMALDGARARLAGLRDQAEAERLARERLEAFAVCDRRAEAARAVHEALKALAAAMRDWTGTRQELAAYARRGQNWLNINLDASPVVPAAMVAAGGYDFPRMMGLRGVHPAPQEVRPLVEADWVVLHGRRERGEEVDLRHPRLRFPEPAAAPPPARVGDGPVVETENGPMRRLASGEWVPAIIQLDTGGGPIRAPDDDGLDEDELAEIAAARTAA